MLIARTWGDFNDFLANFNMFEVMFYQSSLFVLNNSFSPCKNHIEECRSQIPCWGRRRDSETCFDTNTVSRINAKIKKYILQRQSCARFISYAELHLDFWAEISSINLQELVVPIHKLPALNLASSARGDFQACQVPLKI